LNKKSKPEKCCSYICCWRPNKKELINLSENEKRKFQHAENEVLSQKIFKRYLSKSKAQNESINQSLVSFDKNGSNFQIGKNETQQDGGQCYSISELT
jgi:hypothetical protein